MVARGARTSRTAVATSSGPTRSGPRARPQCGRAQRSPRPAAIRLERYGDGAQGLDPIGGGDRGKQQACLCHRRRLRQRGLCRNAREVGREPFQRRGGRSLSPTPSSRATRRAGWATQGQPVPPSTTCPGRDRRDAFGVADSRRRPGEQDHAAVGFDEIPLATRRPLRSVPARSALQQPPSAIWAGTQRMGASAGSSVRNSASQRSRQGPTRHAARRRPARRVDGQEGRRQVGSSIPRRRPVGHAANSSCTRARPGRTSRCRRAGCGGRWRSAGPAMRRSRRRRRHPGRPGRRRHGRRGPGSARRAARPCRAPCTGGRPVPGSHPTPPPTPASSARPISAGGPARPWSATRR
jgi:hypothetical protein